MDTMKTDRKPLTRGEEEVMQILWELGTASVNDIIGKMEDPKPKYTTVATFLRLLENKGYAGHRSAGKSHLFYPTVDRSEYALRATGLLMDQFFDGSVSRLVSCFCEAETLSESEYNELQALLEKMAGRK